MEDYQDPINFIRDADEEEENNRRRPYVVRERTDPLTFYNDFEFKDRFRLSRAKVRKLLEQIQDQIEESSDRSQALSPSLQLLIALRFLATGTFHRVTGDMVGVARTTAGRKIHKVIDAIAGLRAQYIKFPEGHEELERAKREFYEAAGFPGVISVIRGTHVSILCPPGPDAELYRNRKGFMSIMSRPPVTPVTDLQMWWLDGHWPGSTHDSRIWDNCSLRVTMERRLQERQESGIILGDNGYANSEVLLTPLARADNCIFPLKTFAIGGCRTIAKGAFGAQGGAISQCPPLLTPLASVKEMRAI